MFHFVNKIRIIFNRLRGVDIINLKALKKMGLTIGSGCSIMGGVKIDYGHCKHIIIGNNVTLAPNVYILAHDASTYKLIGYTRIGKVIIEDNVFIGANTTVLPNVKIGRNSIIGAGSVVSKNIPANSVAIGSPAKVIKKLEDYKHNIQLEFECSPKFDLNFSEQKIKSLKERNMKSLIMNREMKNGIGFIK